MISLGLTGPPRRCEELRELNVSHNRLKTLPEGTGLTPSVSQSDRLGLAMFLS